MQFKRKAAQDIQLPVEKKQKKFRNAVQTKEMALELVRRSGGELDGVSDYNKKQREVGLLAMQLSGRPTYLYNHLLGDTEFVTEYVKCGGSLTYRGAPSSRTSGISMLIEWIRENWKTSRNHFTSLAVVSLDDIYRQLCWSGLHWFYETRKIWSVNLARDPRNQYLIWGAIHSYIEDRMDLRTDEDFMFEAIQLDPTVIRFALIDLTQPRFYYVVREALVRIPSLVWYLPESLVIDQGFKKYLTLAYPLFFDDMKTMIKHEIYDCVVHFE